MYGQQSPGYGQQSPGYGQQSPGYGQPYGNPNMNPNMNSNMNPNINQGPQFGTPPPPNYGGVQPSHPYGNQPPMQPQTNVIVVNNGNTGPGYCNVCARGTGTMVDYQVGGKTWGICLLLFCFTGVCCWIPFCVDDCKDRVYLCQSCGARKGLR